MYVLPMNSSSSGSNDVACCTMAGRQRHWPAACKSAELHMDADDTYKAHWRNNARDQRDARGRSASSDRGASGAVTRTDIGHR